MSVGTFLAAVLPSQGHRFVLVTFGEQGQPDFRPVQKSYPVGGESDVVGLANWGATKGGNAYFATGGFADPDAGRTSANVTHFRCLRVDVDCGVDKPYGGKREGLAALSAFCNAYSLPLPWIVDSGYGLHAYWGFDRDVTITEWLGMAQRLATACSASSFHIDTTATLDAARVLRMPGTTNYKRGGAVAVRLVCEQAEPVDPVALCHSFPESSFAMQSAVPASMRGLGGELSANMHQPYMLRGLLKQCPGMGAMVVDGGARAAEPLWKIALDLINKADDDLATREKVAHAVSVGHAGYSMGAFQTKWGQVQKQDYHPPTCTAMANAGMPECAGCPMRGRISSPLVLGRPQPAMLPNDAAVPLAAQPPQTSIPTGAPVVPPPVTPPGLSALSVAPSFQVGVFRVISGTKVEIIDGQLTSKLSIAKGMPSRLTSKKNPDGVVVEFIAPMLPYRIVEVERLVDELGQKSITAITFDRGLDTKIKVEFTNGEMTDARSFHSKLQANLLYVSRNDATNALEIFMPEFMAQLQRVRAASQIAGRCGWTEDMQGFILGTKMMTAAGETHVRAGVAPEEMEAYHCAGDEAAWRRAFDIVMSGGPDRQAVLALAIASPLMAFTGLDGVMLNAFSPESGVGKSTLGDTALSIWGAPSSLRKNFRDTANATFKIAGVVGNLPMVIDEFTNVDGKALSDFVYTVTQGREKHRLTSDAKLSAGGSQRWCLACITTANNSVHDKLQAYRSDAVAEAARVFELRLHPLHVELSEMGALKADLQALRTNYGFLGPRLAQLFLSKPPAFWRELVTKKIAKWDRDVAKDTGDRFRSATAALVEIGASIGAAMGFAFDVPAVIDVMAVQWRKQLVEFEAERKKPADFVNDYILAHNGEFMVVGGVNGDALVATQRRYFGEIRGRTTDGKFKPATVMIPIDLLRNHIRDANGNYKAVLEWLRQQMASGLVLRMGRLTFLEGQFQQFSTQAVEFSSSVLGAAALALVPSPVNNVPAQPANAKQ